jgi:hypothetical protein
MIRLLLNISLLIPVTCPGQTQLSPDNVTKIQVTSTFWMTPGKVYVDSIEMDMTKTYLDPDNIKAIKTFKSKDSQTVNKAKKATLIIRKKKEPFISISDLRLNSYPTGDSLLPTVFVIDGILISDTASVKLEKTAIRYIEVLRPSVSPALFHETPKVVFVLATRSKTRRKNGYY